MISGLRGPVERRRGGWAWVRTGASQTFPSPRFSSSAEATGTALADHLLTPEGATPAGHRTEPAAGRVTDDFHGIGFAATEGILAWGYADWVDYTRILPVFPAPA